MDLELCIVLACDAEGCVVRPFGAEPSYRASYSKRVRGAVRIRTQLVAVDHSISPPEIAWWWFIGEVEATEGGTLSVRRADLPPGSCTVVATGGELAPPVGSTVIYTKFADWGLADTANGEPAHPESVRQRHLPRVESSLRGKRELATDWRRSAVECLQEGVEGAEEGVEGAEGVEPASRPASRGMGVRVRRRRGRGRGRGRRGGGRRCRA